MVMFCGILGWFDGFRYLVDEPGWEHLAEDVILFSPWYAPIEDEI